MMDNMEQQVRDELKHVGGILTIEVIRDGAHGPEVISRREVPNLVVNQGKKQLLRLSSGNQTKFFDQFRIGTSAAAANSAHTNVLSPVANTRKTVTTKTLLSGTRTHEWMYSYASGGGSISASGIAEVVMLNQNTTGGTPSCLMRALISPTVNKTTADKLKITYRLRVT
jgi:hypothetical protein